MQVGDSTEIGAFDIGGEAKALLDHFIGREVGIEIEGWQQFVVHARERGHGVSDYMIEVLRVRWALSLMRTHVLRRQRHRSNFADAIVKLRLNSKPATLPG
jgi:hypothetical protein